MECPVQWECVYSVLCSGSVLRSVLCSGSVYGVSCVVGVCMEYPV